MPIHNIVSISLMQKVADRLNKESYEEWVESKLPSLSSTKSAYGKEIFGDTGYNPRVAIYHPNIEFEFDFYVLHAAVKRFIADLPHMRLYGKHTQTGCFAVFSDRMPVEHPYKVLMDFIRERGLINGAKLEPGIGNEMPFRLTMPTTETTHTQSSVVYSDWEEVIPLCNDFYFHTDNRTDDKLHMYFRDEEDFVEASLIANL